jgi:predicted dienelactone hydrolase
MSWQQRVIIGLGIVAFGACSAEGTQGPSPDTPSGADLLDVAVAADTPGPDTAADAGPDRAGPDLAGVDTDPDPGCAGDFCAASPEYAPDPAAWGPFPVGVTTTSLELYDHEGHPRSIRIEIWYPTTDEFRDGPFESINFYEDAPPDLKPLVEEFKDQLPDIEVEVTRDTPPRRGDGPYPLVIFSHGAYGIRFQSVFFTVPLASHGYVVASIDHTGNVLYDLLAADGYNLDDMVLSALDRPTDAILTTTLMTTKNETPGDLLEGMIRPEAIGISGHSFGGFTSLLVSMLDPRIKAAVPQSPASGFLGVMGWDLAEFPVPVMLQGSTLDGTLDPTVELTPAYGKLPAPKFYFELKEGGHFTYSDICRLDLLYIANSLGIKDADNALNDGCADYNIPTEIAHPMINQFAIGFFNYYLRGSTGSLEYFDAGAAEMYTDELVYQSEM